MNKTLLWLRLFPYYACALLAPLFAIAQEDEDEDVFELSQFSVEASEDEGYMAQTTLAGSRIRTSVREIGASLAIVTQEFLEDTGATDSESLLANIGNVEVGGSLGNFANSGGGTSTSETRENPQRAQRVRGLNSAINTRNYFQTDIPFDAYNTTRITVNRGPNSILFGLGSPGGVINSNTAQAQIGTDTGELVIRVDHRGGHRESINVNQTIIEDRLAIRFAMLNETIKWQQEPAREYDKRFYIAWDSVLLQNEGSNIIGPTRFKGSFEQGEINRNAPDVIPPTDGFSSWWNGLGDQEYVNRVLSVPGVDWDDISNQALTAAQVIAAVNAGVEPIPDTWTGTLEDFAKVEGQFDPRHTIDRFKRSNPLGDDSTEGHRNSTTAYVPYFLYPAINYNNPDSPAQGWTDPEVAGIQGIMGRFRPRVLFSDGTRKNITQDVLWSNAATGGAGFNAKSIQNRDVFDYHNYNFLGTTSEVLRDFDIKTFVLEQSFFDGRVGLEIAWDKQTEDRFSRTPFDAGDDKKISIDLSENLSSGDANFDGIPDRHYNENVGRPVVPYLGTVDSERFNEQETFRVTAFGNLNFQDIVGGTLGKILGDHTLTGLYEDRDNWFWTKSWRGSWWSATGGKWPGSADISNGLADNFRRQVRSQIYLGPDTRGFTSADQVRISNYIDIAKDQFPKPGDVYSIWYFDNGLKTDVIDQWEVIEHITTGNTQLSNLESKAYSLNSRFFDGHLVGMYAKRKDKQTVWQRIQENTTYGDPDAPGVIPLRIDRPGLDGPENKDDGDFNLALLELEDEPATIDEDDTTTWSVVGRFPEMWFELPFGMDLYGHYYEAESFVPAGISNNVLNQPLPNIYGTTEEWGFTIELFNRRLAIRYNNFETGSLNNRTNLNGGLGAIGGRIEFYLDRITSAENDTATSLYPEGFLGFAEDGSRIFEEGTDAALTPDTIPNNRQRKSGTGADLMGFTTWDQYYQAIIDAVVPEVQAIRNFRVERLESGERVDTSDPIRGLNSTRDFVATGNEIDIVGRITDNLSVSINWAEQETVTSNTGPVAVDIAFAQAERLQRAIPTSPGGWALWSLRASPFQVEADQIGQRFENQVLRPIRLAKGLDGTRNPEQRKYRWNATVRYDFHEGMLNGLSAGVTARYQDKVAAGYPNKLDADGETVLPVVENPWYGPDSLDGDLFLRYRRQLTDKIDWTIQFNARNLYRSNGAKDIPVTIDPDGTVSIIRVPVEQQYFISNTFSF
ncbi:MAG: TonB-dependent receptor plug domain-containing protein [Verrucomicrobiae bacterium]|nr:TonB-dependent receptor plug domain-containing protein [Verrucomicrobiae bacterium]